MIDDEEWQRHCWEFDALVAEHSGRSLPPGALDRHLALLLARMRAKHVEFAAGIARHGGQKWVI